MKHEACFLHLRPYFRQSMWTINVLALLKLNPTKAPFQPGKIILVLVVQQYYYYTNILFKNNSTLSLFTLKTLCHHYQYQWIPSKEKLSDPTTSLTHEIASNLNRGTITNLIIIGFAKAFDEVTHKRLLCKLTG